MTPKQLHILQHSLGRDEFGKLPRDTRQEYRNRYVVGPGCDDFDDCVEMVKCGWMVDHGPQSIAGGMHCFSVTDFGRMKMLEASPNPPKVSRSRQRYLDYLHTECGESFGEYLKNGWYRKQA